MSRQIISTPNAPLAIGAYSQAIKCGQTIYVSGQIPIDPATGELVAGSIEAQIRRVFENLRAVVNAAGGELTDIAKLNVFLTDLSHFALLNKIMAEYISEPYPARAAIQVSALPKGATVEMDCVAVLN
jgi:reactive intermediate/imine deaminase